MTVTYVPETFQREGLPPTEVESLPGQVEGVFFTVEAEVHEPLIATIARWFEGRAEVRLVDYGMTDKQGWGYLMLEWDECRVDPLFLAILRDEETVIDYTVYTCDLNEEGEAPTDEDAADYDYSTDDDDDYGDI
jgi:hypothetical protein